MYSEGAARLFRRYALPQVVGLVCNSAYVIVDGIFIGQLLGADALAAAAVSVPLIEILISVSIAVASGAGVLISGAFARGAFDRANDVFRAAVYFSLALGLGIILIGNLFLSPLAAALGATPQIEGLATDYMWYIVTFAPVQIFSFLLGGIVRNDGRPRLAMAALGIGSAANVVLDFVFLYVLKMGIGGAAFATALGPVFSVAILLPHFLLRKGRLSFGRCHAPKLIAKILELGFPAFIVEFTIGLITLVYNLGIVHVGFGEQGLAAFLLMGYLMLILLTIFLGIAEGLQPVFSYLTGKADRQKIEELRKYASGNVLVVGVVSYVLILLFGSYFFEIFAPGDPALVAFARQSSIGFFFGFALAGYNIVQSAYWQSTGRTKTALLVSVCRSVVFLPVLAWILPPAFGPDALWPCESFSEGLTAFVALLSLSRDRRSMV